VKQYVGLDVSMKETAVCVVNEAGERLWRGTCASTPEAIAAAIRRHAPLAERIGLETGMLCTWHYHALQALGLPVVCIDARHAKAALMMQINKTDANDAEGLAHIMRTGWFRAVHVKSMPAHGVRALLEARQQIVNMRRDLSNQIRGLFKTFGIVLGKGGGGRFVAMVEEQLEARSGLRPIMEPLLASWRALREQALVLDRRVRGLAQGSQTCRVLMTVPGVGPIIALAFIATIDDPKRFAKSRNVGAHLGLTARRQQSGEMDRQGRISKCGDSLMRHYLFEAAGVLLTRVARYSPLKAWGVRLAQRIGLTKAKIAVARKLAVILHRIWTTQEPFRWSNMSEASV
jgi:transposase